MDHSHVTNWIEVIATGLFTLVGATLGALLAGRYAVNAVKSQLSYDKKNKSIDILDNNLKISTQFVTRLALILEEIKKFENSSLPSPIKTSSNQKNFTDSINRLETFIREHNNYLSTLPIVNSPYDYYIQYQKSLYYLDGILFNISLLDTQKKLLNVNKKNSQVSKQNLEKSYNNFVAYKNNIEKIQTAINEQHNTSHEEYRNLNKSLKNMANR